MTMFSTLRAAACTLVFACAAPAQAADYGTSFDQLAQIRVPELHERGLTGAGVVALLLEAHPTYTVDDVLLALRSTSSQTAAPDNLLGWGILDAVAAVDLVLPTVEPVLSETVLVR